MTPGFIPCDDLIEESVPFCSLVERGAQASVLWLNNAVSSERKFFDI